MCGVLRALVSSQLVLFLFFMGSHGLADLGSGSTLAVGEFRMAAILAISRTSVQADMFAME